MIGLQLYITWHFHWLSVLLRAICDLICIFTAHCFIKRILGRGRKHSLKKSSILLRISNILNILWSLLFFYWRVHYVVKVVLERYCILNSFYAFFIFPFVFILSNLLSVVIHLMWFSWDLFLTSRLRLQAGSPFLL